MATVFPQHKASITILEEQQHFGGSGGGGGGGGGGFEHHPVDRTRSKSLGYPHGLTTSSSASSSPYHTASSSPYHNPNGSNGGLFDTEESPSILNPTDSKGSSQELDSTHGSESDSGYADPIDALQQYYNSQAPPIRGHPPIEPPYQSLAEIQRLRMAAIKLNMIEDSDDPTYSRPFDCLRGLPEPVRVSGGGETGTLGRRNYRRQYVPVATGESHVPSRRGPSRGSSDEAISTSSSSPEPGNQGDEIHPLRRSDRTGSLDQLLESPEAPKVLVKVKDDFVTMRPRVNSDGNVLMKNRNRSCRPDILSPLALTSSTASEQDQTPPFSPQQSPLHVPVEVTRLQNGFAKLVGQDYSSSSSQSQVQ